MNISEIPKNGKTVFRVYCGTFEGKKRYKQFKTKTDANRYIRDEKIRKTLVVSSPTMFPTLKLSLG